MLTRNLLLSGLAAVASAQAVQDANYDDIDLPPAADIHPVNTYKGLTYNAFAAIKAGLDGDVLTGIKISSNPNCVTTQIVSDLLHGGPSIVAANAGPFTPKSVHFACAAASVESVTGVPLSCNLVVKGYNKAGTQTVQQTFPYAPDNTLLADMNKAIFKKSFADVYKLTFETKAQTSVLTSVLYDDFEYTIGKKHYYQKD